MKKLVTHPASIDLLVTRRSGGRVNLRGIDYQLQYSICKALQVLSTDTQSTAVRLEGVEDVDILHKLYVGSQQFYQLKHTSERMTASRLWDVGVLQNFLEVYLLAPQTEFYLITNQPFTDKNLSVLSESPVPASVQRYWTDKIAQFQSSERARGWDWSKFDLITFWERLHIEVISEEWLRTETVRILTEQFAIGNQTESAYLHAFYYHFFQVARQGGTLSYADLMGLAMAVRDDLAKGPVNPAIQYRWIEAVSFTPSSGKDYETYFDGQPARPAHIALNLPVPRTKTERQIVDHLQAHDCAVIRASSGQGKSTLAWRVSYQLSQQRAYRIYQLHTCATPDGTGALVDFLLGRVKIGETPLVVVDGLSAACASWAELASRLADQPVQFIVTTREEDWVRYGRDAYRVKLGEPLGLSFTMAEAEHIYHELRRLGRLHSAHRPWQVAWESVRARNLLMEYVFLLTRGQLLADRLQAQIHQLNGEVDGGAKLQLLRLVATADDAGLPLRTSRLIRHLTKTFRLQSDQGELLRQLEAEYYIRFDQQYVTGLHPVRSNHLTDLLHQGVSMADTLLELARLIEESDAFRLGAALPDRVAAEEKAEFYQELAQTIVSKPPAAIAQLLYGIYQGEILRYQQRHRAIYDRTFQRGGYLLLPLLTVPFPSVNANYNKLLNDFTGDGANHIVKAIEELPAFPIKQTDLRLVVPSLYEQIMGLGKPIPQAGQLLRWFELFGGSVPMLTDPQLLHYLAELDKDLGRDLADAFFTAHPEVFRQFARRQQAEITGWLKVKTQTLTLNVEGDRITAEYILTDELVSRANEESVGRIEIIRAWLPLYEQYETRAIMLPFPYENLLEAAKMNAHKMLTPATINSPFVLRLNRVWNDSLNQRFMVDSLYGWQQQWMKLRDYGLAFVRAADRLLELKLMWKATGGAFNICLKALRESGQSFLQADRTLMAFPVANHVSEEAMPFKEEQKKIRDWAFYLSAFINQFVGFVLNDELETRRLALLNLRQAVYYLPAMQRSFNTISGATFAYFEPDRLTGEEVRWCSRLQRTAVFYAQHTTESTFGRISNVQSASAKHWQAKQAHKLGALHLCLDSFANQAGYAVYKPTYIIEDELLSYAVVGVEGVDIGRLDTEFEHLLFSMAYLAMVDIQFFTFFFCENGVASAAFRVNKSLIDRVLAIVEGNEASDQEPDWPIPVIITDDLLEPLPGVIRQPDSAQAVKLNQAVFQCYHELWQLTEYHRRLSVDHPAENQWLQAIQKSLSQQVTEHLTVIRMETDSTTYADLQLVAEQVMKGDYSWTAHDFANYLLLFFKNRSALDNVKLAE